MKTPETATIQHQYQIEKSEGKDIFIWPVALVFGNLELESKYETIEKESWVPIPSNEKKILGYLTENTPSQYSIGKSMERINSPIVTMQALKYHAQTESSFLIYS